MDLMITPEAAAFREEVRGFIRENLPADMVDHGGGVFSSDKAHIKYWQKALFEKGWAAPGWPVEYGGAGWSATQKFIFDEEMHVAGAPRALPYGTSMVGPVIYTFGSEAQKRRFLPGILSGDVWWCQGYSEPGAGSDLANVKTAAVRDGDHYIVNGQKAWTSFAHMSDWIFCLVRTGGGTKPQEGISFLLMDLKTPGLEIRPVISIDGLHHLNETFFTDVRVPVENRIGEEGMGWTYAKFLLQHERTAIAGVTASRLALERLHIAAAAPPPGGAPLIEDAAFRHKLAEIGVKLSGLEYTDLRGLCDLEAGRPVGAETSMLKIHGTEVQQGLQELAVEAAGYYGAQFAPEARNYLFGRAASLYGGSNEIQRGVIAKAVLGL
ncbi:MAG: acyl-CoA dehydrogenase family protein [Alphaproteobacteria bacterium]|nr:acyl-CoA dehydrogenase family protein [Alphaproteobacteria bacterium]